MWIKMNRKMKRLKNVHFVGIGGSGMSGIAEVMIGLGYNFDNFINHRGFRY